MKKIFIAMMAAVLAFASCKENVELRYNVTATAEGVGEFSWFNGGAYIEGNAVVRQCNDTTLVDVNAVSLRQAAQCNDVKQAKAANEVLGLLTVAGVEGKYRFTAKGYVAYGPFIFAVDEEYPEPVAVADTTAVAPVDAVSVSK